MAKQIDFDFDFDDLELEASKTKPQAKGNRMRSCRQRRMAPKRRQRGYCAFGDPGQLKKTRNVLLDADGIDLEQVLAVWTKDQTLRSLLPRPDRHDPALRLSCGLLNHREFVLMLVCLCLIGLFGVGLDGYLAVLLAQKGIPGQGMWEAEIAVVSHLAFSVILLAIEVPILRIHIGLVSRNELGQEWKNNVHYVAWSS
eukprot:s6716_g4.t1